MTATMERAAIVTGASSGIGFAIAEMLGELGYGLTLAARRADKLERAAEQLRARGMEVEAVAGLLGHEEAVAAVVNAHRLRFGRCDVLVNNAGIGVSQPIGELTTKVMDMQIDINLKSAAFFTRDCLDMLEAAGREHGKALLVTTSSIVAKYAQPNLGLYSASKAAASSFMASMHRELSHKGITCTALCPGFVETPMTEWAQVGVEKNEMIQPTDAAEAVRLLLEVSGACVIPEIQFIRRGQRVS